jgi:hypothetical protein
MANRPADRDDAAKRGGTRGTDPGKTPGKAEG